MQAGLPWACGCGQPPQSSHTTAGLHGMHGSSDPEPIKVQDEPSLTSSQPAQCNQLTSAKESSNTESGLDPANHSFVSQASVKP